MRIIVFNENALDDYNTIFLPAVAEGMARQMDESWI